MPSANVSSGVAKIFMADATVADAMACWNFWGMIMGSFVSTSKCALPLSKLTTFVAIFALDLERGGVEATMASTLALRGTFPYKVAYEVSA